MPLIVHAAWLRDDQRFAHGQLFFWAETQDSATPVFDDELVTAGDAWRPRAEPGRQRVGKMPSHPLQTPVSQLRALLIEQMPGLATADLQPASAAIWVPTTAGMPVVRHTAISLRAAQESAATDLPTLEQWQVTGLTLEPLAALSCLVRLNNGSNEKAGATATIYQRLRVGKDVIFWSHVAKFALELLIGQSFLPALTAHPDGFLLAVWQPYLLEHSMQRRFDELAQMMPPVCRAYNLAAITDALSPSALVEHFVAAILDAAIRTWGAADARPTSASAQGQWLHQLLNGQRMLNLPPQPAFELYKSWQNWTEQLHFTSETTFRICFRLEEPTTAIGDPDAPVWTLHYLLQARDNTKLHIPAAEVWRTQGNSLHVGNRRLDRPKERLQAGLTAASRIFSPIERSLRRAHPEALRLTTDEAYRFLRDGSALLESSGFGVILPEWWNPDRRTGLGLRMRLAAHERHEQRNSERDGRGGDAGLLGPVRYEWELTLGGRSLERAEFEQMTAMHSPLLRMQDHWIELDPLQVAAAQRFIIDRPPSGIMSLLEAVRVVQSFKQDEVEIRPSSATTLAFALPPSVPTILPVDTVDVDGWLRDIIAQLQEQRPPDVLAEPVGFIGALRPYQRRGLGWLVYLRHLGLGACLADDMGLGKTVQAIALLLYVRDEERKRGDLQGHHHHPALLICPTSVVANWRREVERFAPVLRVLVHHGASRLTDSAFAQAVTNHDLIITSYGTARRDIDLLQQWRWSDLILDEAQNIKNPTAKQTQAVRSMSARNRIALTGTPVENRLSELWSIVEFLNPGYLEQYERFRQRFIVPIERYNDESRAAELRSLVQPFLLRRVKSDPTVISDLPEKNEMVVYCSLTQEQGIMYEQVVQTTLEHLDRSDGIQRRGLVLGLLTKLKQVTNHPAHYLKQPGPLIGRSGKLERLTEMLEEALAVGDHALVFTQFVEMGMLLQRHLRETFGVEVLFLHGGTPALQRDRMVQAFQAEDGPPIFILSLRAGGSGLNLTRANHVFHYDRWWNPAVENQATDRAFRIGQRQNVQVHKFVVAGTLEERIHAIVEGKQSLADTIVGSGEQWLTELSTEQLRDLLTLRREMLDEL